jgi:hypothetical protein
MIVSSKGRCMVQDGRRAQHNNIKMDHTALLTTIVIIWPHKFTTVKPISLAIRNGDDYVPKLSSRIKKCLLLAMICGLLSNYQPVMNYKTEVGKCGSALLLSERYLVRSSRTGYRNTGNIRIFWSLYWKVFVRYLVLGELCLMSDKTAVHGPVFVSWLTYFASNPTTTGLIAVNKDSAKIDLLPRGNRLFREIPSLPW